MKVTDRFAQLVRWKNMDISQDIVTYSNPKVMCFFFLRFYFLETINLYCDITCTLMIL